MNDNIIKTIKNKFPIFNKHINGKKLHYLDNAAITHVPKTVVDSLLYFYCNINSNVHRGAYHLSEIATEKYEATRHKISHFIKSTDEKQCVFVKNTTEGINLVAFSYLKSILKEGDNIVISQMEHHSNIVPWYLLSKEMNIHLKIIPLLKSGDLDYKSIKNIINHKTKLISITHISNSLGTINNLKYIINIAHSKNIPVLIDGAQSMLHSTINVTTLDCDFFCFSSHKMYGPNGVGVLYAKKKHLTAMRPYQGGGEMIKHVSFSNVIWNDIPYKFEAGTPSIANIIAFGEAIDFLNSIDLDALFTYKKQLLHYMLNRLNEIKDLIIIGKPNVRTSIVSFIIKNIHAHDLGTIADHYGVSIRTGHHCSIPVMDFYGVAATARASLAFYNTTNDIDMLITALLHAKNIFSLK